MDPVTALLAFLFSAEPAKPDKGAYLLNEKSRVEKVDCYDMSKYFDVEVSRACGRNQSEGSSDGAGASAE
jgi:hypothetical protein